MQPLLSAGLKQSGLLFYNNLLSLPMMLLYMTLGTNELQEASKVEHLWNPQFLVSHFLLFILHITFKYIHLLSQCLFYMLSSPKTSSQNVVEIAKTPARLWLEFTTFLNRDNPLIQLRCEGFLTCNSPMQARRTLSALMHMNHMFSADSCFVFGFPGLSAECLHILVSLQSLIFTQVIKIIASRTDHYESYCNISVLSAVNLKVHTSRQYFLNDSSTSCSRLGCPELQSSAGEQDPGNVNFACDISDFAD